MPSIPRVVVVGGGFGGLQCAKALQGAPVDVLLIDRRDFHLFTPLLYQVASCLLNPSEIAAPLRKVFRNVANVRYREGDVARCDLQEKAVVLADGTVIEYDHLVLATGSVPNYYGNVEIERRALGLKDLGSALQLRNHVLECLEKATTTDQPALRDRLLTFCIVGAGPTGVEYAGALAEFARLVFPQEYPELAGSRIRILLLEGGDCVLPTFKRRLSVYAQRELARRGVDVRVGVEVESADDTGIVLHDGTELATATLVWTAGVRPADILDTPRAASRSTTTSVSRVRTTPTRSETSRPGAGGKVRCSPCSHRPRCKQAASSHERSSRDGRAARFATGTRERSRPSAARRPSAKSDHSASPVLPAGSSGSSCTSTT